MSKESVGVDTYQVSRNLAAMNIFLPYGRELRNDCCLHICCHHWGAIRVSMIPAVIPMLMLIRVSMILSVIPIRVSMLLSVIPMLMLIRVSMILSIVTMLMLLRVVGAYYGPVTD